MDKILTVNDVAAILQVKAITVREMFREKRLRGFKVGKAWRTTEPMLKEDIDALARGESPAELPSPDGPKASERNAAETPQRSPAAPAAPAAPASTGATADNKATTAKEAPRAKKRAEESPLSGDGDSGDDDTQQMLF